MYWSRQSAESIRIVLRALSQVLTAHRHAVPPRSQEKAPCGVSVTPSVRCLTSMIEGLIDAECGTVLI